MKHPLKLTGLTLTLSLFTAFFAQAAKDGHHAGVFEHLTAIQESLAADSTEHVAHHASEIAALVPQIEGLNPDAADEAKAVASAKDIKAMREAFKTLSATFVKHLKAHPHGHGVEYKVAYCPMAKAQWIQTGAQISNPYFGSSMLRCGSFQE